MSAVKAMSLRLPEAQAQRLEAAAIAEATPVSEIIRVAIDSWIDGRRNDPDFQARLHAAIERNQEALRLLAKPGPN